MMRTWATTSLPASFSSQAEPEPETPLLVPCPRRLYLLFFSSAHMHGPSRSPRPSLGLRSRNARGGEPGKDMDTVTVQATADSFEHLLCHSNSACEAVKALVNLEAAFIIELPASCKQGLLGLPPVSPETWGRRHISDMARFFWVNREVRKKGLQRCANVGFLGTVARLALFAASYSNLYLHIKKRTQYCGRKYSNELCYIENFPGKKVTQRT